MSGMVRALATGLEVRQGVEVSAVRPEGAGWRLDWPGRGAEFARVVLAVPAPQAAALLPAGHDLAARIAAARYDPCLTLMAAFPGDHPAPFEAAADDTGALSWIAQDSAKPGRAGALTAWVAQASPAWSARHLELDRDAIAARMLPLLCARIGADSAHALHVAAHRWRYARVAQAAGVPFLRDAGGRLHAGGDWCLGARVEAAWTSGTAIAADILGAGPA
jgi:predicted NAD/FAD-dependent oxidoreductase